MENRLPLRISLGLIVAVFVAYFPVEYCEFVNFDDPSYVYNNSHVKTGLTRENVIWAWTTFEGANWHPLTWMWHQLDCQLFELRPRMHHLVNLGWHIASTVVLYLVLRRMTGEDWRPALVAALFGLHPLHVESVAWVSERKDVTSTFFALVTLAAYTRYAARPSLGRYLAVLAPFVLGLLCKPMLVTWPFVLLLMDYWPLRRTPISPADGSGDAPRFASAGWSRLVLEKLPLLAMAAASSLVTMRAQRIAMKPSADLAVGYRLGNAVVSYAVYLRKMVWPMDLAAFYRHIGSRLTLTPVIVSAAVLIFLSLVVLLGYRRRPALLVGWLWYLGTLVPVIGLVQVGLQSMADRYSYIPLIGIFLALAWSIPSLAETRSGLRVVMVLAISGALVICAVLTFRQTFSWINSVSLWQRAVKVAENPVSHAYYAGALYDKARERFSDADELPQKGRAAEAERLVAEGKTLMAEAERECWIALEMEPTFPLARVQLADYFAYRNDLQSALDVLSEGVALDPKSAGLQNRLGRVLAYMGRIEEARGHFREASRLDAESAASHFDYGTAIAMLGNWEDAEREWQQGRQLEPDFSEHMRKYALDFLERTSTRRYCPSAAVFHAQEACWSSRTPQAELYQVLAEAYAAAGQPLATYLAAQRALALAEANSQADLLPNLRQLCSRYEPLARRQEAGAAAIALTAPAFLDLPGTIEMFAVLEADWAGRRFLGEKAADMAER